jgi:hypothetical protein
MQQAYSIFYVLSQKNPYPLADCDREDVYFNYPGADNSTDPGALSLFHTATTGT